MALFLTYPRSSLQGKNFSKSFNYILKATVIFFIFHKRKKKRKKTRRNKNKTLFYIFLRGRSSFSYFNST